MKYLCQEKNVREEGCRMLEEGYWVLGVGIDLIHY